MRKLKILLGMAALATTLVAGGGSAPADASTIGVCTVDGTAPAAVVLASNGVKVSRGMAQATCTSTRWTQVCFELWADDQFSDNRLSSACNTNYTGPTVRRFWTAQVACNEDIGTDELYSRAMLRYYLGDGQWTRFVTDNSPTYNFSC